MTPTKECQSPGFEGMVQTIVDERVKKKKSLIHESSHSLKVAKWVGYWRQGAVSFCIEVKTRLWLLLLGITDV